MDRRQQGVGLLELLVICFISAILIRMAVPGYTRHIVKSNRLDGQLALLDLANRLTHYHTHHHTYATATIGSGDPATDILARAETANGHYRLHIVRQTDTRFRLHAIPIQRQATQDKWCQTLTLTDQGERDITEGPGGQPIGDAAVCWT
jgi:type IV pilus assembly protein PilE